MPNAIDWLLAELRKDPLPRTLPAERVFTALKRLGYVETIKGSHHTFRRDGRPNLVIATHSKNIKAAPIRDIRDAAREEGLL